MLRRNPSTKTCHFCNTSISDSHSRDFKCSNCGSWNMFDKNGRLVSDHPAMHDEALNTDSFAKRASPNKNRIPSSFSTNVFCHTCQTNQTLTMNLLSNYLPSSSDPSYSQRLAEYPAYKESLYARYPPVCAKCEPAVDEQIRQKDTMAKSAALGGWLQASARRSSPGTECGHKPPGTGTRQVVIWNTRGVLWLTTAVWWLLIDIQGGLTYPLSPKILPLPNLLIGAMSIVWQFWDPTWKSLQQTRLQGHEVRVEGKVSWLRCQGLIWVGRAFLTMALRFQASFMSKGAFWLAMFLELLINLLAFRSIRIVRPPRIRLVASSRTSHHVSEQSPTSHDAPSVQQPIDVPTFSGLSLSSTLSPAHPTRSVNPIFGVTSLPQQQPLSGGYDNVDPADAMDWAPTAGYTKDEAAILLRPARFAPEKPTGLEGLIEKFGIDGDDAEQPATNQTSGADSRGSGVEKGVAIGMLAGLGLVGVVAFVVTWWPQWLAHQQSSTQVLTPQHIIDNV
ncbi:Ima1 amino-terminal domain protein [Rhizoctonia solani 123E]|uniref:Ima1 amino-terminal domain protein n=1 Tax=Rhizoctonia solani 123E TaxID=1423351 RepID=A0A074SK75_9AGAM|nr:Ima1 amino-terminal domain protein [Rhizoctonia solani 123E]